MVRTTETKTFPQCCRSVYKTKTGEEVTGKTDEFLFYLSLVTIVRTSKTKQNLSISMATSSPVFVFVLSWSYLSTVDGFIYNCIVVYTCLLYCSVAIQTSGWTAGLLARPSLENRICQMDWAKSMSRLKKFKYSTGAFELAYISDCLTCDHCRVVLVQSIFNDLKLRMLN